MSVLIVDLCKEKLHYFEFVKPIKEIVKKYAKYFIKHNSRVTTSDFEAADKIILCGTPLGDNHYLNCLDKFNIIKRKTRVLGICAGMQLIGIIFGLSITKAEKIGMSFINFEKEFLGLRGCIEVYFLHTIAIKDTKELRAEFEIFSKDGYVYAIKHKHKDIYGVLFYPEVRNTKLIIEFLRL